MNDRPPELVRAMRSADVYPHPVDQVGLREAHISWVVLTGPFVYKIKKPVDPGFLDFTTLEKKEERTMPYNTLDDLPKSVKNPLPKHAREIYRAAFNSAWDEYKDPENRRGDDSRETVAHKVAWAAVKKNTKRTAISGSPSKSLRSPCNWTHQQLPVPCLLPIPAGTRRNMLTVPGVSEEVTPLTFWNIAKRFGDGHRSITALDHDSRQVGR